MDTFRDRLLDEREASVLSALVYDFIATGKPVGSRTFVQKYRFSISPATMRNIMADLETMGYLKQPHTSAGRVPTDRGYRYYVDSLLEKYHSVAGDIEVSEEVLSKEMQFEKLFYSITKMLSSESQYAGVMLTPSPYFAVLKKIELIPLAANEVLAILVARTGMIFTKKVKISASLTQDAIYDLSKYLNSELCGYAIQDIKESVIGRLREQDMRNAVSGMALDIAELSISGGENVSKLYVDGMENLFKIPDMIEKENLDSLLHLIEEKNILRNLLEMAINVDGVRTMIGSEIKNAAVKGCSMVTTSYKIGNRKVGVVGVLGPRRMDYEKVVPLVDYTGRVVSDLLTKMSG